ncbi:MAG TPA: GyrI-like domain-containing protein [Planctomycetota bacterium]|nr:GyrI-like domain-containing protein [Planctomycetota bacterium]
MEAPQRKHIGPQTVAFIEHKGPYGDIGRVYQRLFGWAARAGVRPAGPAFTCFLEPPDKLDWAAGRFEVCLPVAKGTAGAGGVRVKELPATDVLAVVVQGPYSEMPAHYSELLAWMSVEGEAPAGPPRETYLVHPGPDGSGDPKTFRTEIQFPVSD